MSAKHGADPAGTSGEAGQGKVAVIANKIEMKMGAGLLISTALWITIFFFIE